MDPLSPRRLFLKKDGKLLLIHGKGKTPSISIAKTMDRKFKSTLFNSFVVIEYEDGQNWKKNQGVKDAKREKDFFNIVIVSEGLSREESREAKMIAIHIQPLTTRVLLTLDEAELGTLCTSEPEMEMACGKGCPLFETRESISPPRPFRAQDHRIKDDLLSRQPRRPLTTIPIVRPEPSSCPEIPLCGHDHNFNAHDDPDEMSKFALDDIAMVEAKIARVLKHQQHIKMLQQQEVPEGQQDPDPGVLTWTHYSTATHYRHSGFPPATRSRSRSPRQTPCRTPTPMVKPEPVSCPEIPLCGHDQQAHNAPMPKFALEDISMHHYDKELAKILLPRHKW